MMPAFLAFAIPFLWIAPLLAAAFVQYVLRDTRRQRATAIAAAWLVFLAALALFLVNASASGPAGLDGAFARDDVEAGPLLALHYHMAVDGLNAVLLPMTAALALGALLSAPRSDVRGDTAARILVVEGTLLGAFMSLDLTLMSVFWLGSLLPLWQDTRRSRSRPLHRVMTLAVALTAIALIAANVGMWLSSTSLDLITMARAGTEAPAWVGGVLLFVSLLRMGIVPVHLWLTAAAAHAPGYSAMLAILTPLGSFALARAVMPLFPGLCADASAPLIFLGGATALYGALLAVGQHDLRRVLGSFWVSQMGLVLTGLATLDAAGVAGALLQSMSTTVEVGGLMLIALEVEARAGTTDMRRLGGLVGRAPRMATGFLLLSAAAVGFPGTISFVAEDLAIQGLLEDHKFVAAILLIVTAINGIALFKAFKQTFLGPPSPHDGPLQSFVDLRGWEHLVAVAMMGTLLVGGFMPQPLLAVRTGVVDMLGRITAAQRAAH
jgi:NADH-quinone oxidoreductase subunit M